MAQKTIYIIAGEPSGDLLGAKLIHAIKSLDTNQDISFHGIGGNAMENEGIKSLFPIKELSLMGFIEIIPHIPNLLARIKQTTQHILDIHPDMIITIDSPGFNFQLVKSLRNILKKQKKSPITFVHYVAPTVWAYKPSRAKKTAKLFDHMLLLLPFEPPFFHQVGLDNSFIGHPIVEQNLPKKTTATPTFDFRKHHNINADTPLLVLLPGSREGEIKRHAPTFYQAALNLQQSFPRLKTCWIVPEYLVSYLTNSVLKDTPSPLIISNTQEKNAALSHATLALCKSGTISLELATYNLPMIVTYKVNPLSAMLIKHMLRCQYVSIINLLLGKMVIPELLQKDCTAEKLTKALRPILADPKIRQTQQEAFAKALAMLGNNQSPSPSTKAAQEILTLLYNSHREG